MSTGISMGAWDIDLVDFSARGVNLFTPHRGISRASLPIIHLKALTSAWAGRSNMAGDIMQIAPYSNRSLSAVSNSPDAVATPRRTEALKPGSFAKSGDDTLRSDVRAGSPQSEANGLMPAVKVDMHAPWNHKSQLLAQTPRATTSFHALPPDTCIELKDTDALLFVHAGNVAIDIGKKLSTGQSVAVTGCPSLKVTNAATTPTLLLTSSIPRADAQPSTIGTASEPIGLDLCEHCPAPDGSQVSLLADSPTRQGGLALATLKTGCISTPVRHKTVEEHWFVRKGHGQVWRQLGDQTLCEDVAPGSFLSIPTGTTFQFKAKSEEALEFLMVTLASWPGSDEAVVEEKACWRPSPIRADGLAYTSQPKGAGMEECDPFHAA